MIPISVLKRLCLPEHSKLHSPTSTVDANGVQWTFASNGHGCVLVRSEEELDQLETPICPTTIPAEWTHLANYADVADTVRSSDIETVCDLCLGCGWNDEIGLCCKCDGKGTGVYREPVSFRGVWIDRVLVWKYLSVVHADTVRLSWPTLDPYNSIEARPLGIAALDDSWRVFIMPMRPPNCWTWTRGHGAFPIGIVEPIGGDR